MRRVASRSVGSLSGFVRRHRPDYSMLIYIGILLLLGLVVLYGISPARVEFINDGAGSDLSQAHFMQRQLLYLLIGLISFGVAASVPLRLWQKYAAKILLGAFGACLLLAILGAFGAPLVLCASGACRWFDLGFITFQPAELVKFGLLLFVAVFLGKRIASGTQSSLRETLLPLGLVVLVASLLIIGFQKDMGSGIALIGIIATMLFLAGVNKRAALLSLGALLLMGGIFIAIAPHRLERVATFFNPSADTSDSSYHINQAKIALGSGGLFGLGLGNSIQAFGYLPEAVNDSIFAILGELFGFTGLLALLGLFVALLLRLLNIMDTIHDPPSKMFVAGVFGWVATHIMVNIGAMVGIIPLTGITLPLVSFGGTSLVFIMLALGLTFQLSRYTSHVQQQVTGGNHEDIARRRGIGRSRHTAGSRRG